MNSYKIIFESGVTETIEAEEIELNDVLDTVNVIGQEGQELEGYYLDLDAISAIIPNPGN